jgi:hypothetical protein
MAVSLKIYSLSPSSIKSYDWCPFQFYLKNVLKFQDESGPAAEIGQIAHRCLEIISKAQKSNMGGLRQDLFRLWEVASDKFLDKNDRAPKLIQKRDNITKGLQVLVDSAHSPYTDKTIATEKRFKLPFTAHNGNIVNLSGIIDRVDDHGKGIYEIVDYKSGLRSDFGSASSGKKESDQLFEDVQALSYVYALADMFPEFSSCIVTMYYLTDGGPVTTFFGKNDLPYVNKTIGEHFTKILTNKVFHRVQDWKCSKICYFGKSGICNRVWEEGLEEGAEFLQNKYSILNKRPWTR